jgi:hypothetical protein
MELDMTSVAQQQRRRLRVRPDVLDVPLEDTELLEEMRLATDLFIAASQSQDNLSRAEIDRVLGLG